MIKIQNLTKKYGDKTVVNNLSMEIKEGEFVSLLGVNGAGKTTTVKMLSCLIKSTSGNAFLNGKSISEDSYDIKKITNISPQETAIAKKLTVRENLEFICGIYGLNSEIAHKKASELIEMFSMQEVENQRGDTLSGGWQRRLSIAMALITQPQILFLDEPTLGLDVIARRELWEVIKMLKGKVTVILTTHYLEEAEKLSDRIAIMSKGNLIAFDTVEMLIKVSGCEKFEDAFIKLSQNEVVS